MKRKNLLNNILSLHQEKKRRLLVFSHKINFFFLLFLIELKETLLGALNCKVLYE